MQTLTGHEEKIRERELAYRKREEVLAQEEARLEHRQEQTESRELALQQRDTAAEEADAAFKLREKKNREQEANMQRQVFTPHVFFSLISFHAAAPKTEQARATLRVGCRRRSWGCRMRHSHDLSKLRHKR